MSDEDDIREVTPTRPGQFQPGDDRINRSGRPTKEATLSVMQKCLNESYDPIQDLIKFAKGDTEGLKVTKDAKPVNITPAMRLKAIITLCKKIYPDLKSVEVDQNPDGEDGNKSVIVFLPSNGHEGTEEQHQQLAQLKDQLQLTEGDTVEVRTEGDAAQAYEPDPESLAVQVSLPDNDMFD